MRRLAAFLALLLAIVALVDSHPRVAGARPGGLVHPIAAWTPKSISSLAAWWNGGVGVTVDGSNNVQTWADQSGHGNDLSQATAANRPAYTAGPPAYATFVAGTNAIGLATSGAMATMGSAPYEVIAVIKSTSASPPANAYIFSAASNVDVLMQYASSPSVLAIYDGTYPPTTTVSFTTSTVMLVDAVINNNSSQLGVNTTTLTAVSAGASGGSLNSQVAWVGNYSAGNSGWPGAIYEVVVTNAQLSSADRKSLCSYECGKYGIACTC